MASEPFEVPMVAFCYNCRKVHRLYPTGAKLDSCPNCGSTKIDNYGVEVSPVDKKNKALR